MKLKLRDGHVIEIMPYPKRKRRLENDEFEGDTMRWMALTIEERDALMDRMMKYRAGSFVRTNYLMWACANLKLPTLPCEGVEVISYSEAEEDAIRAYWDGWLEQSEKVWELERKWPTLTRAQREDALVLVELMAADLPIAKGLRDWMKANLADTLSEGVE